MHRRNFVKATAISIALATAGLISLPAVAADTIKVGILHSLSGTMAISETAQPEVIAATARTTAMNDGFDCISLLRRLGSMLGIPLLGRAPAVWACENDRGSRAAPAYDTAAANELLRMGK